MRKEWRLRIGATLLAAVAAMGCNPIIVTSYLLNSGDPKRPAEIPLKPPPAEVFHERARKEAEQRGESTVLSNPFRDTKQVRVVVLTYGKPGSWQSDFPNAEQRLGLYISQEMDELAKKAEEKIFVMKQEQIEKFKAENTNWRSEDPAVIGRKFNADYVIEIEIADMAMYNSNRTLLQGKAVMSVRLIPLHESKDKIKDVAITPEWPKEGQPIMANQDMTPTQFRDAFFKRIAKQVAIKFVPHDGKQLYKGTAYTE